MSGNDESVQSGLITQRMAAERGRGWALTQLALGAGWFILGVVHSFKTPHDCLYWVSTLLYIVLVVGFITSGLIGLRARARRVAAFDAEYGKDAGRQSPL